MSIRSNEGLLWPQLLLGLCTVWVISLIVLLSGLTIPVGNWLRELFQAWGFSWSQEWTDRSPASLAVLLFSSGLIVFALKNVGCWGRRVLFLFGLLLILSAAVPILALWGIFWNASSSLLGVCLSWVLVAILLQPQRV